MIRVHERSVSLPFYQPVPLTRLPLLYHPGHYFPYTSYGETEPVPTLRCFRVVTLENEFLRVEVAPELGGRVLGLFDKRLGQEVLFRNPVVKPVRVPPIGAFFSGGIEFCCPVVHSPTALAEVGCVTGQRDDYGFVRVGEREARTGLEWVVELGLAAGCAALVQRTALRNRTAAEPRWTWWTIAAVRSTEGTEFVHPPQPVRVHGHQVITADWPAEDLRWDRAHRQMAALLWPPGGTPHFGAFHHDLGFGLLHWADPAQVPGQKVWTYGHGRHRAWGQATTEGGYSYCELESSPLPPEGEPARLAPGSERSFEEWWIPVHTREALDQPLPPKASLPPVRNPWLGWAHSPWQREWERFRSGDGPLPASTVPTGIELEAALRQAVERGHTAAREPLALWLAFHGHPQEALEALEPGPWPSQPGPNGVAQLGSASLCRLVGLIRWKGLHDPQRAMLWLEAGPLEDPVAVTELDELYAELGLVDKRVALLAAAPKHPLVLERQADLALALGKPGETLQLLAATAWPRQHQRYVRTDLWRSAQAALGEPEAEVPETLGEDTLAR